MKFFGRSKSKAKVKKEDVPLRREGKERTFDRTTPSQALRHKYSGGPQAVDEVSEVPTRENTLRSEYQREFAPTNSILSGPNRQISAHELNSDGKLYRTEKAERSLPKTPWLPQTESISETNNEDLRAENTRLTKHISLLERQVQESSKTIEKLRNNAQGLKGSWEQRTRRLEKDLEVSESRNSSIRETLKKAERDRSLQEQWTANVERQLEERNESAQKEMLKLEERNEITRYQKDEEIENLRYELENLRTCHMKEQTRMENSLKYELKDLRNHHMKEQMQMEQSLENEVNEFRRRMKENEEQINSLYCELMEAQLAREESERSKSSVRERLNATEALLSQKENRVTELEQQIQENTDMIAETRLILNQSRNELNVEKRKARQASQEVADKNRKLEFLQQECAKMSEDLIKRRVQ